MPPPVSSPTLRSPSPLNPSRLASPARPAEAVSGHDSAFVYRVGETVSVPNLDRNWQEECAPGVHFFITRAEAEAYQL